MNSIIAFTLCVACASASVIGHGTVVSGPSGIVTDHGAIGPVAHHGGLGWGGVVSSGHGLGGWGGSVVGHGLGWGGVPVAHSAVVAAPALSYAGLGHGLGLAGGYGNGLAHAGYGYGHGLGHGGVVVQGPHTAPAVIAGPSGKIVADGLWGPTAAWGGHHGGW